jgi:hypothetical protein
MHVIGRQTTTRATPVLQPGKLNALQQPEIQHFLPEEEERQRLDEQELLGYVPFVATDRDPFPEYNCSSSQ